MLSYRHAFHAGNFADVLKHAVLHLTMEHMVRKDKAMTCIDTHAGAGMYRLQGDHAQKTGEYQEGIAKLWQRDDLPEALQPYIDHIKQLNPGNTLKTYPGSPAITQSWLRRDDNFYLYELHPNDHKLLNRQFERRKKVRVAQSDGYHALKALLPPPSRRGMVLIDPPYELKTDYQQAIKAIQNGYQRFSTGTYMVWYPVVKRGFIDDMVKQIQRSQMRNVLQIELCIQPDNNEFGMTGTGMLVVNPPWKLKQQMEEVLPYLVKHLGSADSSFSLKQLVEE
ncbi:23S rRNA (adenine(2030)-N(6))-methyltransferase RlmJ [Endozoicomonadaceae bacterium StTr2]